MPSITVRRRACAQTITALFITSCAAQTPGGTERVASRSAAESDTTQLAQLERDARALAKTGGCEASSSCRASPVGWRGCGGPRTHIVYCAAATDTSALLRKLDELKQAEMRYNERVGGMSTCEMRLPPRVDLAEGRCTAR